MAGRFPPETEKPVPEAEPELMVTATLPLDVTVTDFDTDVPTDTLPNDREVVLNVIAAVAAFSCKAKLFEELFAVAVIVAVCVVLTDATLVVNGAEDAPEATATLAGRVTAPTLLERATSWPADGAAEFSDTVHAVVPAPVNEFVVQDSPLTVGAGGAGGFSVMLNVCTTPPPCAVIVAVCAVVKLDIVALKPVLEAPDFTVTADGTVT